AQNREFSRCVPMTRFPTLHFARRDSSATGPHRTVGSNEEGSMRDFKHADAGGPSIKVGVIADQSGPLSVMGLANGNVARMVIGDLNAKGGLLGRHVELCLEDSATNDQVAAARAAKLVEHDRV